MAKAGRLAAGIAVAGFVAFNFLLAQAISANQKFRLLENYLSDLGAPLSPSAIYFNLGCAIAGCALAAVFYLLGKKPLGILCGAALLLVGLFPEGSPHSLHFVASAAFFVFGGLQALLWAVERKMRTPSALLGSFHALAASCLAVAELAGWNAPLFETLAAFTFQIFALAAVFEN
ncbi:MAG: DUF998 domain-containing protein [Candidatus Micrarchaeota archaeon]|nr:DUF998 domain-containing protein [Candidatus Micrarchaeota archaeon]